MPKKSKYRKLRITIQIYKIHDLVDWMRNSGIPFRAKLYTQWKWTRSRQSVKFFSNMRFPNDGTTRDVRLDLQIRHEDYPLLRLHYSGKIGRYVSPRRTGLMTSLRAV